MYREFHYKQIIPCTVPTNALFSGLTDDEDGGEQPVVCWALVDEIENDKTYTYVVGLVYGERGELDLVETISNFKGYKAG